MFANGRHAQRKRTYVRLLVLLGAALILGVIAGASDSAASTTGLAARLLTRHAPATDTILAWHRPKSPVDFSASEGYPWTYTVRRGDTLMSIAAHAYGRSDAWTTIYYANKHTISDPSTIEVGWHLRIVKLVGRPPAPPVTAVSSTGRTSTPPGSTSSGPPVSADGPQAYAQSLLSSYGWNSSEMNCLVPLWDRESGWRWNASNASGAYGIPQALPGSKMASAGADWQTNPDTQVRWGLSYIKSTYGSPCAAWGHEQSVGYYSVSARPLVVHEGRLTHRRHLYRWRRLKAFWWGVHNAKGCWYVYGGAGPCADGYDCSGLAMRDWEAAGIDLPHNTVAMLNSGKLVWIPEGKAHRGDLAFFGTGHVEVVGYARNGHVRWTFGARDSGTRVQFWRVTQYFAPTAYYQVR